MPKRFRDTEIWGRAWYRLLPPAEKCAFDYILDNCDSVGVWAPDLDAASYHVGEAIDWAHLFENCNGNIEVLENGKVFVPDFCLFQYPRLSPESTSKPILSYLSALRKHGLLERVLKGYGYPIHTVQEKEKEKDMEKEKEKEKSDDLSYPQADVSFNFEELLAKLRKQKEGIE